VKKAKAPRVPILENAFEVNLPKLMRAAKATGDVRVVLNDGAERAVAMLTETRLAIFVGGRSWVVDILAVQCLKGRLRPLLKCPRAHEGNFQSLYYRNNELACRHCHALRYRTNLAPTAAARTKIARSKFFSAMGTFPGQDIQRQPRKWRSRHLRQLKQFVLLSDMHYEAVKTWIKANSPA
jgi:hypothetical protein